MKIALIVECSPAGRSLERLVRDLAGPGEVSLYPNERYSDPRSWLEACPADAIVAGGGRLDLDWLAGAPREAGRTIVVADDPAEAVRAFEWGVADFVPGPVDPQRLARAIARVGGGESPRSPAACLAVRKAGRVDLVPVEDLVYVQAADNYAEIVLRSGRRELLDGTLGSLMRRLPPDFARVHKSYVVRLSLVQRIRARGGSHHALELSNGDVLPVGRTHYKTVRARLLGGDFPGARAGRSSTGGAAGEPLSRAVSLERALGETGR